MHDHLLNNYWTDIHLSRLTENSPQVTALFVLAGVLCIAYTAWAEPAAEPEPEAAALAKADPQPLAYPGSSSSGGK
jgi:hypothetical protein